MSWQLSSATATLSTNFWSGVLDLENPQNGFSLESDNGLKSNLFPISLMQVPATPGLMKSEPMALATGFGLATTYQAALEANASERIPVSSPNAIPLLSECFVRQGDLIVVYPQREGRPFSLQLDYRILPIESHIKSTITTAANPLEKGLLVELWISLQTYLLDTHPTIEMDLHLNRTSAPPSTHPIAILSGTCPPSGLHVTYFVDPHDQRDTKWRHHDVHHRATFFGHFMEKGVIRRARLRCLVTRMPVCSDFIADQYQQLVESPLPLTA